MARSTGEVIAFYPAIASSLLVLCMFAADCVPAAAFLLIHVAPLFTVGIAALLRAKSKKSKAAAGVAA